MSAVSIRPFEAPDLKRILVIENACFGEDAWPADLFLAYARRHPETFMVATDDRAIAGYSITSLGRERAELASIAVHPRYRGRGIAAALLRQSVRAAAKAGMGSLWLTVRTGNFRAIQLYEKFGFRRTRTVYRYYENGENGYRMSREL